ncbi:MAG: ABC transporter ATP-binding protein/permease [bacterium]|nr:ABC transporter ATP-binding protein/permease [bacterium]
MERQEKMRRKRRKYARTESLLWAMKRLWELDKGRVVVLFAAAFPAVALPLTESFFARELIDHLAAGTPFAELILLSAAFLSGIALLGLLQMYFASRSEWSRYYPTGIYQTEMAKYENSTADYENGEKQEFKRVRQYAQGDSTQGDCAMEFMSRDLSRTVIDLCGALTYASLLASLHPLVFAVTAATAGVSYFTARWQPVYYEKNKEKWEKEIRKKEYLQELSLDFPRAKDIRLYGIEDWLERMMRDYQAYILMWEKRCSLRGLWASLLSGIMALLQNGTAYLVLIGILMNGGLSVGEFVFYFGLVGGIAGFLQGILKDVAALNGRADKIAYYREYFDYPNRFNRGAGAPLPKGPVTVEFRNVRYRYDGAEEDTLKGINLTVGKGEKLALVGVNGAGKTTLVKLLCGMYTPTEGEILVDGRPIGDYNIDEYYSMICAVFQEIHLLAFTVFEFVASSDLNRPTAREDAEAAMKAAGIYEKIRELSAGMDTHLMKGIYDDGVDLSGGEIQKLLLARAIYKKGSILVLDEPTAALDPIAENELYLHYRELTEGKTSVYISHRFASTRFCDRIVLLEDGKIKESGSHEELMAKGGAYAWLFGVQSKYYKEGEINA